MNQRWGAQVQTHQKDVLPNLFLAVVSEEKTEDNWILPWHHCFYDLKTRVADLWEKKIECY